MLGNIFEVTATILFTLAIFHTFSVYRFQKLAHRYPSGSIGENLCHLLGEVEVVFGLWAAVLVIFIIFQKGSYDAIHFLENQNFTEPAFVFVIMTVAATRPILNVATQLILAIGRLLPVSRGVGFYIAALICGPLLGSLITEPAAMTVTALVLKDKLFDKDVSSKLKYGTLGLLFVNVSVGGTLTHFAAPPVLMVASKWGWSTSYMLTHFGYKSITAVALGTLLHAFYFRKELDKLDLSHHASGLMRLPAWLKIVHILFLALVVATAHHMVVFLGLLLFFIGFVNVTQEYQSPLKLREGLLVGFFLGGLVILGGPQRWWLEPLLNSLGDTSLFFGATALTAITDNAALTYLGSQVPDLSEMTKYFLVAGAVTGGGLTVIANAPNPAGYGILQSSFGEDGISPLGLFASALIPTLLALICLGLLPSLAAF